ncbi:transcription antitermination factor NusB [Buchnera aphidicola (Ceratoglyphina bambusae)]|uniref:transcription antitermination factor NusB n=1 Tax=Buchnera aphidicola TaxID=9 RepID=UPI0031B88CE5
MKSRRRARECAVQLLYSWQISKNYIKDLETQFIEDQKTEDVDIIYFHEIISGISKHYLYLDNLIKKYIAKKINTIGQIEKAILRISFYELTKRYDIPYKVAINEGIELAKHFGNDKSYKLINGILDKAAHCIRTKKYKIIK